MRRLLARLKRRFFRRPPSKPYVPALPAGTVDTSAFNEQLWSFVQALDRNMAQDPTIYRKALLDSSFLGDHVPDYSNENATGFYLGRYGSIYAFEYYLIYRMALEMLAAHAATSAHVYTLGCGSMLDAWSLVWARDSLNTEMPLAYTGIDLNRWPTQFDAPLPQELRIQPMEDLWDAEEPFDGNLLLFPKVLSELPEGGDTLERFCDGIRRTEFARDTIALCFSYRSKNTFMHDWRLPDWCKAQEIIAAVQAKGYRYVESDPSAFDSLDGRLRSDAAKTADGSCYPYYYLRPRANKVQLAVEAPDFAPIPELADYLIDPGTIRRRCVYFAHREEQYRQQHSHDEQSLASPKQVCEACCPIICNTEPLALRKNDSDKCFQVLLFQREASA